MAPPPPRFDLWTLPEDAAARQDFALEAGRHASPAERARHKRLTHPTAATQFLAGRALLRTALAERLGGDPAHIDIQLTANGKPYVADAAGLAFSLSHAAETVVVAIGEAAALGIDCEPLGRAERMPRIARAYFGAEELAALGDGPDGALACLHLWLLKESVTKALGATIWDGVGRYRFTVDGGRIAWASPPPADAAGAPPTDWALGLWRLGDMALAAAARRPAPAAPIAWTHRQPGVSEPRTPPEPIANLPAAAP